MLYEREEIVSLGRGEQRPYERDTTIHALFERQAQLTPDALAVVAGGSTLTYERLRQRSNRLANYLRSQGVAPGVSVGIALERSADLVVGLLGILKAGAAYVPLDLSYPAERLQFIVGDAAVRLIVSGASARDRLGACGASIVALDADAAEIAAQSAATPETGLSAEALAYVIYTSGSTGRAKGVAVSHRGVVRLVRNTNFITVAPDDVFLQFAPVAFDASTFEIWGPLLNGARLAVPPPGLLSMDELGECIARFGVTTLFLTTSLFQRVVESRPPEFGRLRRLLTGGEVLSPAIARRFMAAYPTCGFIHCYGPTENTTFSTTYEVPSLDAIGSNVPIGRPIANSSAYVLDEQMQPVPIGVAGELCVGGDGVACGYLGLDELTAERFVRDPFSDAAGARLYRTGDRVRLQSDGLIEFIGRTDDQVKIRGFRIELGEIEANLRLHDDVREAVVVLKQQGDDKMLVACVVSVNRATVDERALRMWLGAKLPAYMIPHRFVMLEGLPEHASGKLDRVALARLVETRGGPAAPVEIPASTPAPRAGATVQAAIAEVWRDVLGASAAPGIDENFFDAGGDSLLLLRVHGRLKEQLGVPLGVMDLFEHSTIRSLAAFVGGGAAR